jgi:hypothetical protein
VEIPKQKYKIIKGYEMRKGRVCKKEMLFVKHNEYMGFIKLENGEHMDLGEMQLRAFERLIKAAEAGEVYIYGRDLLDSARSGSSRFCSLFQRKKNWRQFIDVEPTGFYRLKLYADPHRLKYERCVQKVKKRKAMGLLLNRKGERY